MDLITSSSSSVRLFVDESPQPREAISSTTSGHQQRMIASPTTTATESNVDDDDEDSHRFDATMRSCSSTSHSELINNSRLTATTRKTRTGFNNTSVSFNRSNRINNNSSRNALDLSTMSNLFHSDVVMAITEGRGKAKGEVGLAYIDLNSPILYLAQFVDNCSLDSLKMKCHVCLPVEIIYPHTLNENNMMLSILVENFPNIDFKPFDRHFFSENNGLEFVQSLCYHDYTWIDISLESKYYCLSACAALLQYILTTKQIQYAPKSMKIVYQSSLDTLILDPSSIRILELIINLSDPRSTETLFGTINRSKTKSGYVSLRSSIMQPSTNLDLITQRLDMVEAISSSFENFTNFENILTSYGVVDLDQLLVNLIQLPNNTSNSFIRMAEKKIEQVIRMKHVVTLVDQLKQTLEQCNNPIFDKYIKDLNENDFKSILDSIDEVINSNTKFARGGATMRLEKCFAIKDRYNPLLDLARSIYSETIDDIIALVKAYETKFKIEGLKMNNTVAKGFFMQIKRVKNEPPIVLPPIFRDVSRTKCFVSFTTEDLMRLNNRLNKTIEEIYLQSDQIITKLIYKIRSKISCFYVLTDIIANLDLVFSFAYQCSCSNYVRPSFGNYTEIKNGIHPVLEKFTTPVPNSFFINDDLNFHIITGPNMSGKTTFLRKIAILQIMAQIGSFVPAESANFKICDKLFTRMGVNDNLISSSRVAEVKGINYIVNNLSPNCLILIDELDRGSGNLNDTHQECWDTCETLIDSKAYTIFATHFIELAKLSDHHLNVSNYHFSSEIVEDNLVCAYPHKLLPGPTEERNYGIKLAELCGLKPEIVERAKQIAAKISENKITSNSTLTKDMVEYRAKYRLAAKLIHLVSEKGQTLDIDLIRQIRDEFEEMKRIESLY